MGSFLHLLYLWPLAFGKLFPFYEKLMTLLGGGGGEGGGKRKVFLFFFQPNLLAHLITNALENNKMLTNDRVKHVTSSGLNC